MKKYFFLLIPFVLFLASCGDDDEAVPTGPWDNANLHYDVENFAAPALPSGTHIAATRFTSNELNEFNGQKLDEILFYLQDVPSSCILTIREQGTNTSPGTVLHTADLSTSVGPNGWNQYLIPNPIEITGDDIWLCLEVVHNSESRTVGCDPGTANNNGDWLNTTDDNNGWQSLRNYTSGEVDINWNIRGVVNP